MAEASDDGRGAVLLVIDRNSRAIHDEFRTDLDRLRMGRTDYIRYEHTLELRDKYPKIIARLHVIKCEVADAADPETKYAIGLLGDVLENRAQAEAAWAVLCADAQRLCAEKQTRTRKELVDLLSGHGIRVGPIPRERAWSQTLDMSRDLLHRRRAAHAFAVLDQLQRLWKDESPSPGMLYRYEQQRAAAHLFELEAEAALSHARAALEFQPDGLHALQVAVRACLQRGDVTEAKRYARQAIAAHPNDADALALEAECAAAAGEALPPVPEAIAHSDRYRLSLREIAISRGDWHQVLEITETLLADGKRDPTTLLRAAQVKVEIAQRDADAAGRKRSYEDAVRLATEVIVQLDDSGDPLTALALQARAAAHRGLGDMAAADADMALSLKIDPDDPTTLRLMVMRRVDEHDFDGALEILRGPTAENDAELRATRAGLFFQLGNLEAARTDLAAVPGLVSRGDATQTWFLASQTAVDLADLDSARRFAAEIPAAEARHAMAMASIAIAEGDWASAREHVRQAAERDPARRSMILAGFAVEELRAGRLEQSAATFDSLAPEAVPSSAIPAYVEVLMRTHQLERAKPLIEVAFKATPTPGWVREVATALALRQEDADTAIGYLQEIVRDDPESHRARITLAYWMIETGRASEASVHLDALAAATKLSAEQRMQLAQLLLQVGRASEAVALAHLAYRQAPQSPELNRAFAVLLFTSRTEPIATTVVDTDTHVVMSGPDDRRREYTIYSAGPIDHVRGEISSAEAAKIGLMGKKIGDEILEGPDNWMRVRWTISEIIPAVVYSGRDVIEHFEERFPGAPFFVKSVRIGNLDQPKDFAPLVASVHERRAFVEETIRTYRDQVLPLGFVQKAAGGSIPEVMAAVASGDGLLAEWPDLDRQSSGRAIASAARSMVLTRSALHTIQTLGLLDQLPGLFELNAPVSLRRELMKDQAEADKEAAEGRRHMTADGVGLAMQELEAGDPRLIERFKAAKDLSLWADAHVRFMPRPLASIGAPESETEQTRDIVGAPSYDAVALSAALGAPLFADDLGLRRLGPIAQGPSFSSLTLLDALAERLVITTAQRDDYVFRLVLSGYLYALPHPSLLVHGVSTHLEPADAKKLFDLLIQPTFNLAQAAAIVARTLRLLALAPVHAVSLEWFVDQALSALARRWPAGVAATALRQAADRELTYMLQLDTVKRACETFARRAAEG
ncbi:MAG TPA: tetratricopeptide repeat protein [Usitatibacter sp.]|nr:tetratricopeptide repeat protein [Usitatibacter sp.]